MADQLTDLRAALTEYFADVWKEEVGDEESDALADAALGDALGYSASLVSQLRRGAKNVTVEHLAQLAALKGVPVIAVLGEIVTRLGQRMGAQQGVEAPGSTEGSAVLPGVADKMRRSSEADRVRRGPGGSAGGRKPPAR